MSKFCHSNIPSKHLMSHTIMSKFKSEEVNYVDDGIKEVIIPKGLIDPNETTIIEIPEKMENVRTVIARPRSIPVLSVHNPKENIDKKNTIKRDEQFCFNVTQVSNSNNKLKSKSASKSDGTYSNNEFYEAQTSHYPYYENTEKVLEHNKNPDDFESVLRKQAFSMYHQAPNKQIYHETEQHEQYFNLNNSGPNICQYCNKHKKSFKNKTHAQIEAVLNNLEALEFKRIQNDLINFQSARRKIIFEATGFQL